MSGDCSAIFSRTGCATPPLVRIRGPSTRQPRPGVYPGWIRLPGVGPGLSPAPGAAPGPAASRWVRTCDGGRVLAAYLLAAALGAGNETLVLTAGNAHASPPEESVIKLVAYSSAPTAGLLAFTLLLEGLRVHAR